MNQPTSSRCPRCQSGLLESRSGDLFVHGCGGCGGLWLDNGNARRAIDASSSHASHLSRQASRSARRPVRTSAATLACPACAQSLDRIQLAPSGVEVDICQSHGTWFDRDELTTILRIAEPASTSAFTPPPGYASASPASAPSASAPAPGAPSASDPAEPPPDFRSASSIALQITSEVATNLLAVVAVVFSMVSDD